MFLLQQQFFEFIRIFFKNSSLDVSILKRYNITYPFITLTLLIHLRLSRIYLFSTPYSFSLIFPFAPQFPTKFPILMHPMSIEKEKRKEKKPCSPSTLAKRSTANFDRSQLRGCGRHVIGLSARPRNRINFGLISAEIAASDHRTIIVARQRTPANRGPPFSS